MTVARDVRDGMWYEVFAGALSVISRNFRRAEDWPRIKVMLAEAISGVLLKYFRTIKYIALADLSGGECGGPGDRGLDMDMLFLVDSPAEAFALIQLEEVVDSAVKEALVYTLSHEKFKMLVSRYKRGIEHNIVEFHVNYPYSRFLVNSSECPPLVIYDSLLRARTESPRGEGKPRTGYPNEP